MKNIIATILIGAIAVSALAGQKKDTIACAVMPDHKVNIAKATKDKMFADYKGHRYFFCCGGCPAAFKKNPEKFAKAASIPTPKSN
jgi:YHS domain-containing protein